MQVQELNYAITTIRHNDTDTSDQYKSQHVHSIQTLTNTCQYNTPDQCKYTCPYIQIQSVKLYNTCRRGVPK